LRARGHTGGEPRLPLDCSDGDPVVEEEAVAYGARDRICIWTRHSGGNADCVGKNGPSAIWRLDDNVVGLGRDFRRNDVEADPIGNGRLSGRKRSQASNRLFDGDFAVYNSLDIAKGQAGVASDGLGASDVDAGNG
jgi:hypothetical protein